MSSMSLVHLSSTDPVIVKHFKTLNWIKSLLIVMTLLTTCICVSIGAVVYRSYEQLHRFDQVIDNMDRLVKTVLSIESGVKTKMDSIKEIPVVGKVQDLWSKLKKNEHVET